MKLLVHGMIGFALTAVFVLGVSLDQARAQGAAQPPPAVEPVVEEPAPTVKSTPETAAPIVESVPAAPAPTMDPTAAITYQTRPTTIDGHTMEELNNRVRRVRIALFSSSGVFAAGLAVAIAGATQCETINDQTFCNSTGDALFSASAALLSVGGIGMITSGIMLGVRKGKRRRLQRETRYYQSERLLKWDPETSQVVF